MTPALTRFGRDRTTVRRRDRSRRLPILVVGDLDGTSSNELVGCLVESTQTCQRPGARLVGVAEVEIDQAGIGDNGGAAVGVVQREVTLAEHHVAA